MRLLAALLITLGCCLVATAQTKATKLTLNITSMTLVSHDNDSDSCATTSGFPCYVILDGYRVIGTMGKATITLSCEPGKVVYIDGQGRGRMLKKRTFCLTDFHAGETVNFIPYRGGWKLDDGIVDDKVEPFTIISEEADK